MEHITKQDAIKADKAFYYTGQACVRGHMEPRYVRSGQCIECVMQKLAGRSYVQKDIELGQEKYSKRVKRNAVNKAAVEEHNEGVKRRMSRYVPTASVLRECEIRMWQRAKARAAQYNKEFDITLDDVRIPARCPVLGIPIAVGIKAPRDNSPSLDRIDNSQGYVKGNVMVISNRANSLKRDATIEEMMQMTRFYSKIFNV